MGGRLAADSDTAAATNLARTARQAPHVGPLHTSARHPRVLPGPAPPANAADRHPDPRVYVRSCALHALARCPQQDAADPAALRAAYEAGQARLGRLAARLSGAPPALTPAAIDMDLNQRPALPGNSNMTKEVGQGPGRGSRVTG